MTTTKSTAAHTHTFLEIFSKFESQKNNVRLSFDSSRRENSNLFFYPNDVVRQDGGEGGGLVHLSIYLFPFRGGGRLWGVSIKKRNDPVDQEREKKNRKNV